jgi:hypothetical protein
MNGCLPKQNQKIIMRHTPEGVESLLLKLFVGNCILASRKKEYANINMSN